MWDIAKPLHILAMLDTVLQYRIIFPLSCFRSSEKRAKLFLVLFFFFFKSWFNFYFELSAYFMEHFWII